MEQEIEPNDLEQQCATHLAVKGDCRWHKISINYPDSHTLQYCRSYCNGKESQCTTGKYVNQDLEVLDREGDYPTVEEIE